MAKINKRRKAVLKLDKDDHWDEESKGFVVHIDDGHDIPHFASIEDKESSWDCYLDFAKWDGLELSYTCLYTKYEED